MIKPIFLITLIFILFSCSKETIYSGKILNQEDFENINFKNKENLLVKLGPPSFIDPIENKYFYYSEKKIKKSAFNQKTNYSYIFVFKFDTQDNITISKVYDLKNNKNIDLIKEETDNNIVKRGLLEKIFGGVGPQQSLPSSP